MRTGDVQHGVISICAHGEIDSVIGVIASYLGEHSLLNQSVQKLLVVLKDTRQRV